MEAVGVVARFDDCFTANGQNALKIIRDMIEHFDDYAAGKGRVRGIRDDSLDPWRVVSRDRFERGQFIIEKTSAYSAAIQLRSEAKDVGKKFTQWLLTQEQMSPIQ